MLHITYFKIYRAKLEYFPNFLSSIDQSINRSNQVDHLAVRASDTGVGYSVGLERHAVGATAILPRLFCAIECVLGIAAAGKFACFSFFQFDPLWWGFADPGTADRHKLPQASTVYVSASGLLCVDAVEAAIVRLDGLCMPGPVCCIQYCQRGIMFAITPGTRTRPPNDLYFLLYAPWAARTPRGVLCVKLKKSGPTPGLSQSTLR